MSHGATGFPTPTMMHPHAQERLLDECGMALILALLTTMLLTALGSTLIMLTITETRITMNYRNAQASLYGADAGIERAIQDLATVSQWNQVLSGSVRSGFVDGSLNQVLPDGIWLSLATATRSLQDDTDALGVWGANNPRWRLYAHGPLAKLLPSGVINSTVYIAVWVGDDPSENDGDPSVDSNGVLTLRADAYGPSNTRKVVEVTVERTSRAEVEPPTAQRGQQDSNQGSRPASGQSPENVNGAIGLAGLRLLSWREVR